MALTREDFVEQSVSSFIQKVLFGAEADGGKGYPPAQIEFLDAFDDDTFAADEHLSKNYIASGYDFDDDGTQAELGSDLVRRMYTFELFSLGISSVWARNLAQGIKFAAERDGIIPLLNIEDETAAPHEWPVIDALPLVGVSANRVLVQDPAPWQRHLWVTTIRVEDTYYATLA